MRLGEAVAEAREIAARAERENAHMNGSFPIWLAALHLGALAVELLAEIAGNTARRKS